MARRSRLLPVSSGHVGKVRSHRVLAYRLLQALRWRAVLLVADLLHTGHYLQALLLDPQRRCCRRPSASIEGQNPLGSIEGSLSLTEAEAQAPSAQEHSCASVAPVNGRRRNWCDGVPAGTWCGHRGADRECWSATRRKASRSPVLLEGALRGLEPLTFAKQLAGLLGPLPLQLPHCWRCPIYSRHQTRQSRAAEIGRASCRERV